MDIKHISQTRCHITISTEVKINLESVGKHCKDRIHGCKSTAKVAVAP